MAARGILVALFLAIVAGVHCFPADDSSTDIELFPEDFQLFERTGIRTKRFREVISRLSMPPGLHGIQWSKVPTPMLEITCNLCEVFVNSALNMLEEGKSQQEIEDSMVNLCVLFNIETERVCRGTIHLNMDTVYYIATHSNVTGTIACGIILQLNCAQFDDRTNWEVEVDVGEKPKPNVIVATESVETLKVIHISDLHYDPRYTVGGNAVCGEPTCCRLDQGDPADDTAAANYWGDYRECDMPWHSITNIFQQVKQQHTDIAYIIITGDLIDHGVWETTREGNLGMIQSIYREINTTFPDILVLPVLGNHEPSPLNVFSPPEITEPAISTNWLYEAVADLWSMWLPDDAIESVRYGGYYTMLVRPGLRFVGLNTNYCYTFNWWLLYNSTDIAGQLHWLANVLLDAENQGEKVHIAAHIPPGNADCWKIWSGEFRKLIHRFEETVTGQFYGHTHNDEFYIQYDLDDPTRANNVAFLTGSGTTYSNLNPTYHVFHVDGVSENASWHVMDHESWIYNLTEANLNSRKEPQWYKLYSFNEAYGTSSALPSEMDDLVHRMAENDTLIDQYYRFFSSNADPMLESGCDSLCKVGILCAIVTSVPGDTTKCEQIKMLSLQSHLFNPHIFK